MKRSVTFLILLAAMTMLTTSYSSGPYFGGTGNRTGSAGSAAGCDGIVCHAANGGSSSLSVALLRNGVPVQSYIPGENYRIRLTLPVLAMNLRNFGFQASVVRAADGVLQAGILSPGGRSDVTVHQDALVQLAEHNRYLAATRVGLSYLDTVSFGWQAPMAGMGSVRVYAVVNAVDSNRLPSGDQPRAAFQDFRESTINVGTGTSRPRSVRLSPNPVIQGQGPALLQGLLPGPAVSCAIVDVRGLLLLRRELLPNGSGSAELATGSLPPGTYTLLLVQDRQLHSLRFEVK